MSTTYNRRRGAKANTMRKPRQCTYFNEPIPWDKPCLRLAPVNRYCSDHQRKVTTHA